MSIYRKLDSMSERSTQVSKGKREHKPKVNVKNMAYSNQHIDIEIQHGSRYHAIVPDTIKIAFSLNIESTCKTCGIVNSVSRTLVKKKVPMLGSKKSDIINNSDVYAAYEDLYLSEKEPKQKLLQGIQSENSLKVRVQAKRADGTAIAITALENVVKKIFGKRFGIPTDFDFFKHLVYPYRLKEDLNFLKCIELNCSEKGILCIGDTGFQTFL